MDRLNMKKITIILILLANFANSQTIQHINNGEQGNSVRNKLNSIIDTVNFLRTVVTGTASSSIVSTNTANLSVAQSGSSFSLTSTTPTLTTVGNATLTGSYPTQTLTVPSNIITGSLTSNYIPYAVSSSSLSNTPFYLYNNGLMIGGNGDSRLYIKNNLSNYYIACEDGGGNGVFYLNPNGRVGIGILQDVYKLQVNGSFASASILDDGSNVGIGTTPSEKLHVNGNIRCDNLTSNSLTYSNGSKNLSSVTLGSGLSLSNGTLSATSTSSTTTLTAGTNINLTGSAPNYTVAVDAALTSSISTNTSAISTLSTNVTANTSSITTLQSSKQNTLVAGENITLNTNTISAASPTITAGSNISVTTSGLSYTVASVTTPTFTGVNVSGLTASQLVATDANKALQTLTTSTYPSLTELSYVKGVTSAIQTQLDAKLSSTADRLLAVTSFASFNPADATNYSFGSMATLAPNSTLGRYLFTVPFNCTVTKCTFEWYSGTTASSESVSLYIRENGTTDKTITTSLDMSSPTPSNSNITRVANYTGLSLSLTSGTTYEIKIACPTWSTNPTTVIGNLKIYGY